GATVPPRQRDDPPDHPAGPATAHDLPGPAANPPARTSGRGGAGTPRGAVLAPHDADGAGAGAGYGRIPPETRRAPQTGRPVPAGLTRTRSGGELGGPPAHDVPGDGESEP